MLSILESNKKSFNNINNQFSYNSKIKLDQYNNYKPNKNKSKTKQTKIILNPKNNNSKENINKSLNNSFYNNSFNKYTKQIKTKTKSESSSLNKKNKRNNIFNQNSSFLNKKITFYRNNINKNNNLNKTSNSLSKTSFDFFKTRLNYFNSKYNINNNNKNNIKSLQSFSKINKKTDKVKDQKRAITPILSSKLSKNNSKSKNKSKIKSHNNSREKKLIDNNIFNNKILNSKTNINIHNLSKKYDLKHNIRTKIFQANNIFAQFKPKKKSQTIILQEELQMKQKSFISKCLHSNNTHNIGLNKNNNITLNKNDNVNCFIEIHPKIIQQQESENNLKLDNEESNKEILPLTNNSTTINILNSTNKNTNSKSNSNIKSSSTLKHQNNNNILNNNDSNVHSQKLNIHSSISLNENTTTLNINNINTNNLSQNQKQTFNGKKIKCIHEISKTGLSGVEKKINQDRDFIFRNFVEGFDNIFMGVCDGHGFYGNEVSEYIKENLPMDLNRIIKTRKLDINKDDLTEVIINTFIMENNALFRNRQIDSDLSGSTCISVIYTPKKLIIANVGDSRCVLGSRYDNEWKFENLSRDHKPNIQEEADRIKQSGGRIRPMIDEDGCFVGPLRVYMKDKDLPGLAMTRSFGDYFASIAGTIAVPEIKEHILIPEDKFMILASDGLFEFISSEEVGNIIKGYYDKNDIVGCCEYLYKESYRKWISEEEDTVDDITIILVFFED